MTNAHPIEKKGAWFPQIGEPVQVVPENGSPSFEGTVVAVLEGGEELIFVSKNDGSPADCYNLSELRQIQNHPQMEA